MFLCFSAIPSHLSMKRGLTLQACEVICYNTSVVMKMWFEVEVSVTRLPDFDQPVVTGFSRERPKIKGPGREHSGPGFSMGWGEEWCNQPTRPASMRETKLSGSEVLSRESAETT